ncbi:PREDICTED: probable leucine-rich repeat receptor-like protein kinase At1g35710 isoform X2 [Theobroma cacao]|uniref:Probable leucine-rich repeat receptor-like protein kinase At1g35710 isoform X2 n=1 Tax=Theobroma cacao TaxID=3641 RepID=A0AB32WU60_THECC|nr:PREDICTED: probable leucine-rich repeat receptor-like protein kinase At1g35710 isoform X2 [Theobroma cacao]
MVLLLIRQSSLSFRVSFFFTLLLLSSFHVFVSVSVSNSSIPRDESTGVKEANALLKWKASLDHQSQSVLSSWVGNDTCYWIGIICDKSGRVSHLNLSNSGLIEGAFWYLAAVGRNDACLIPAIYGVQYGVRQAGN